MSNARKRNHDSPGAALARQRWAKASQADKAEVAKKLTEARAKIPQEVRSEIARKAAQARWGKEKTRNKSRKK